jgi:uncharacterized membrane protein YebE (DUF533 family)
MFRGMIALAWADHDLDDNEKSRILVYIKNNKHLSAAQAEQLALDLDHPVDLDTVWPEITDVQDRAHLINLADVIFWEDGEMCRTEKQVYEKIRAAHIATLDEDFIRQDIAAYRTQLAANREAFDRELHQIKVSGPFGRMMHYLETMVDRVF